MSVVQAPRYSPRVRWILYAISATVSAPTSGLLIWFALNRRGDPESKALGRRCGIISLVAGAIGLTFLITRRVVRARRAM